MRAILLLTVVTMVTPSASAGPVLYPAPPGLEASPLYEVTVDGRPLFVYPCRVGAAVKDERGTLDPNPPETTTPRPAALCYFDSGEATEIVVTVREGSPHGDLGSAVVRPSRHGIEARVAGRRISFRAPGGPCQLSVEPNGSAFAPLHVFINPPEEGAPVPGAPGVTHYFGPGVHEAGLVKLEAGSTVYLAGGAVVYGQFHCASADDVRIFGRGILDAGRAPSKPSGGRKAPEKPLGRYANQVYLSNGRGVRVEGIILLDSPSWVLHLRNCREASVRNVKIVSWR